MMQDHPRKAQIEHAKQLLRDRNIDISISGCGCCGSPAVYLEIDGKAIIFDVDIESEKDRLQRSMEHVNFSTFD